MYKLVTVNSSFFSSLTAFFPVLRELSDTLLTRGSQFADDAANSLWVCKSSEPPGSWGDDAHVSPGGPLSHFLCYV